MVPQKLFWIPKTLYVLLMTPEALLVVWGIWVGVCGIPSVVVLVEFLFWEQNYVPQKLRVDSEALRFG